MEPKSEQNIKLSIEVRLSGNSSFYLVVGVWGPDRYILYRGEAINQFRQRVGLGNSYCNHLAIRRYFFHFKTFSVVDKIYILFFEKLNYSTAFFIYCCHTCLFSTLIITYSVGTFSTQDLASGTHPLDFEDFEYPL